MKSVFTALFAGLVMSSCMKKFVCECTVEEPAGNSGVTYSISGGSEKSAKNKCSSKNPDSDNRSAHFGLPPSINKKATLWVASLFVSQKAYFLMRST